MIEGVAYNVFLFKFALLFALLLDLPFLSSTLQGFYITTEVVDLVSETFHTGVFLVEIRL